MTAGDYNVRLDVFEGPLDLLLHLVKKHELPIIDIPVSFITEKYLEYLELMRSMNLDVAGEYLLMAATLVHLKSRELLPTPDPLPPSGDEDVDGEDEDPRQELIRRLLEYQKYKEAAAGLGGRPVVGRNVWTRGSAIELDGEGSPEAPLAEVPLFKLVEALADVLRKARIKISHEVIADRLSITDRINQLVDRLEAEGTFSFRSCFDFLEDEIARSVTQLKHQVVVTFLAILEMTKLKLIRILQAAESDDITITRAVDDLKARAKHGVSGDEEYR
jgi:segregation and condensation protein A